jgi:repressor LexA
MDLTPRQADILLMIRNHRHLRGYSPSIREICDALGLCRGTIMSHVDRMVSKGLLRRSPGMHRTLEVVEDSQGVDPQRPKRARLEEIQRRIDKMRETG